MPVYTFSTKNRPATLLVTLLVLGAGVALLLLGIALLAGIAIVGGVLGSGLLVYRALRGQRGAPLPRHDAEAGLDPALEVFADPLAIDAPAATDEPNEERRRLDRE